MRGAAHLRSGAGVVDGLVLNGTLVMMSTLPAIVQPSG
jgi:hypothetical protein